MKKTAKLILASILFVLLLASALAMSSCSGSDEITSTEIVSAEINRKGDSIEIKATVDSEYAESHKRGKLYLLEVTDGGIHTSFGGATPLDMTVVKDSVEFKIPLYDNGRSRLCSGFVIAEYSEGNESTPAAYIPITNIAYPENPEILAKDSASPIESASIKGLRADDTLSAAMLGVSHMLYEVRIDKVLLTEYSSGAICHDLGGETFFFDSGEIGALDKKIKTATDCGMRVYLRFVLGMPEQDEDGNFLSEPIDCLYCPDAELGKKSYAVNMTDPDAVRYIQATFDLFSSRYASGGEYGCAADFIIGQRVNGISEYNNAGSFGTELYESCYNALVRTAHNTLLSYCADGQVYVPVDSLWRADESTSQLGSKAFLNRFLSNSRSGLGYGWNIAVDLGAVSGELWSTGGEAYTEIGVKSMHELTALLSTDDYLLGSQSRRLIVSDLTLPASSATSPQSYAYAYYTLCDNTNVSAFIYSTHKESGATAGLVDQNGGKTSLHDVFKLCGTSDASDSLSSVAGAAWSYISAAAESESNQSVLLTVGYGTSTLDSSRLRSEKALFDFSSGESFGFFADGGAEYCALVKKTVANGNGEKSKISALTVFPYTAAKDTEDAEAPAAKNDIAVIRKTDLRGSELRSSGYIGIKCSSEAEGQKIVLTITDGDLKDSRTALFVGEATVGKNAQNIYFDISEFSRNISASDNLTVSVYIEENEPAPLTLYGIYLYGSSGGGSGSVATTVIVTVIILAFVAILLFLIVRRKRGYSED